MDKNRVIGNNGGLPWKLPSDLKRFKALTMGHPIIMGRKTFESIGRVLPGRTNIVITRNGDFQAEGAKVAHGLADALHIAEEAEGSDEIFVIGGQSVFEEGMVIADKIYTTLIEAEAGGDKHFPEIKLSEWTEIKREKGVKTPADQFDFEFVEFERNK